MDVIIEDNVLYRFKKKWVNRYCKLVKTNNFSDSVKLLVFTYEESKNKKISLRKFDQMISKHVIYGHLHGIHLHNETHVLFIVCKNSVECLAFKEFSTMKAWSDKLSVHLNDINQPACLTYSDKNSLLKSKLDGRLFINYSHISFIRDTSCSEPRLLMAWKIADIAEFGCSKEIRKGSTKIKSNQSDSKFIIRASPLCDRAPNFHIFSCSSPKIFCDRLEQISSNQENFHSPNEFDLLRQRSRTESDHTINRYSSNWSSSEAECSPESPLTVSNMFFSDSAPSSRVPRFQRSVSEAPRTRSRIDSSISIDEEKEFELNDKNVSLLYSGLDTVISSDLESPVRSATYTWLERYPYEREPRLQYRRLTSETNHDRYLSLTSNIGIVDQRQFGPKSSSSYCSLVNLRSKYKPFRESSSPEKNSNNSFSTSNEPFHLSLDKNRGLISRRFPKATENSNPVLNKEICSPCYVNLEFNSIFDQINKLCSPAVDTDQTLKT